MDTTTYNNYHCQSDIIVRMRRVPHHGVGVTGVYVAFGLFQIFIQRQIDWLKALTFQLDKPRNFSNLLEKNRRTTAP